MKYLLTRNVKPPQRGTEESAGLDFFVPDDYNDGNSTFLEPGDSLKIPSGVKMVLPKGKVGVFMNKSSHGSKGLLVGASVVDSDYRGEVHLSVFFLNQSNKVFEVKPGMKLVQMLILDVDLVQPQEITETEFENFNNTERGDGGFGSTGV